MPATRLELRAWRLSRGLTQQDLFNATGIRIATISNIENGKTRGVDFDTLTKLARVFGVEPGRLFTAPPSRRKR